MRGRLFILMCLIAAASAGSVTWALRSSNETDAATVKTATATEHGVGICDNDLADGGSDLPRKLQGRG
jgi:hypothetical protein